MKKGGRLQIAFGRPFPGPDSGVTFEATFSDLIEVVHQSTPDDPSGRRGTYESELRGQVGVAIRLDIAGIEAMVRRALHSRARACKAGPLRVRVSPPSWRRVDLCQKCLRPETVCSGSPCPDRPKANP
jgi:hypothetical protein